MLKVLVDGKEIVLPVQPQNDLTVVWEFDAEEAEDFKAPVAQIQHRFTSEGVMVQGVDNHNVKDLSHSLWTDMGVDVW